MKKRLILFVAVLTVLLHCGGPGVPVNAQTPKLPTEGQPTSAPVPNPAVPSFPRWVIPAGIVEAEQRVVRITTQILITKESNIYRTYAYGSGFIERTGRILVCEHFRKIWESHPMGLGPGVGGIGPKPIGLADRILVDGAPAIIVGFNSRDVMVLAAPTLEFKPLEWETILVKTEPVTMIGNPVGLTRSITSGEVTNLEGEIIFLNVQTVPGNSGSILLNRYGKAVGMVFAKIPFYEVDRFGYARPASMILDLLKALEDRKAYENLTDPTRTPVEIK